MSNSKLMHSEMIAALLPRVVGASFTPSLEAAVNEREVEYYIAKVDMDVIRSRSVRTERQEQWGVFVPRSAKNVAEGSIRVRETIIGTDEPTYELTGKLFMEDGTKDEYNLPADKDLFKFLSMIADQGMVKTRYHVPVTVAGVEMTLEIDDFDEEYVKIDLELPEGAELPDRGTLAEIIDFPFEGEMLIVTPSDKKEKNEAATKGHKIASKLLVANNKHLSA